MKIFDCFPFFNELELLELRLMELYDRVDHFVLVEANKTHRGKPKEYLFEKNKNKFAKYLDKIIHIKVDDFPEYNPNRPALLENFQRNAILRGLKDKAVEGDKIMVSDCDEIPDMDEVEKHFHKKGLWIHFRCHQFYYYVNFKVSIGFGGVVVADWDNFGLPQRLRDFAIRKSQWWHSDDEKVIIDSGWHYSYLCFGDYQRVKLKSQSIFDTVGLESVVGNLEELTNKIENLQDLYCRGKKRHSISMVDTSNLKPKSMDKFLKKYPQAFYKPNNHLTIGILSWKSPQTLRKSLLTYQKSGLFNQADQVFIYFQEISDEDKKIAKEFGIKYYGSTKNLGIAGGYQKMLDFVKNDNYLFLEDDWIIRNENFPLVYSQIKEAVSLLNSRLADVARLRCRVQPGHPLWSQKFMGQELNRPEHLLDCVHWHAAPDEQFPEYIKQIMTGWYSAKSINANWTNNPHLIKTHWAKTVLLPHLGNGDIETSLNKWWQTSNHTVAQGSGLFTHDRTKVRGIEINLHQNEALSNHIRRENDFFEAEILDYLRDHLPDQKCVVDIGANIGNHTVYFANYLKYKKIACFEPEPENFNLLRENTHYPNIEIHQVALSNQKGELKMTPNKRNMGASMITENGNLSVTATTLDDLNLKNVSLIKIDVEGYEPQVIAGAQKTINKYHPHILIEDKGLTYPHLLPNYIIEKSWPSWSTYLYRWVDRPYLLSAYSYTPGADNYLNSLKNLNNSVEIVDGKIDSYPGHLRRWDFLPPVSDKNRLQIFTDTADVIFQKPFPDLSPEYIYVANEGEVFENNAYWRGMIRRLPHFSLLNKLSIYNVGTFACNGHIMDNWVRFIQKHRRGVRYDSVEQMIFNVWLRLPENISKIREVPDLFCSMYANINKNLAKIENGKVYNSQGQLFTLAHFNGNMKQLMNEIQ